MRRVKGRKRDPGIVHVTRSTCKNDCCASETYHQYSSRLVKSFPHVRSFPLKTLSSQQWFSAVCSPRTAAQSQAHAKCYGERNTTATTATQDEDISFTMVSSLQCPSHWPDKSCVKGP